MPEGDTVWRTAARLHRALAGQVLTRSDFRVPAHSTVDLAGAQVHDVVAKGKHLLTRVAPDVTVHTHLKMEGSWHVYRPASVWRGPAHQVRVVLATGEWVAVGFRLGVVQVLPTADEDTVVGHLGPDLLGSDWDPLEAGRRLLAAPERQIGDALLDQRNLAGIGNMYKSELCYLAGVHPWTPVGRVPDLGRMLRLGHQLLAANKQRAAQTTTGDTRRGRTTWVFDRADRACLRCGSVVRNAEQGEHPRRRVTFWCPGCQPER